MINKIFELSTGIILIMLGISILAGFNLTPLTGFAVIIMGIVKIYNQYFYPCYPQVKNCHNCKK